MSNKIIIVTPVFEDNLSAKVLFQNIHKEQLDNPFIIAIDDGSVVEPLHSTSLREAGCQGKILRLKRNVGHQKAIAVGLNYANEICGENDLVVIMDSDGEDNPESIKILVEKIKDTQTDIVFSGRKSRVESIKFKLFYIIYKLFFKTLTGKSISFGNFMILNNKALKRIVWMEELPIHIAACLLHSRLSYRIIPIRRGKRYVGKSNMNFPSLVLHGFRALMVFADLVLVRIGIFSSILMGTTIVGVITASILKGIGMASQGWYSVALGILGILFLQTISLSVLALIAIMISGRNSYNSFTPKSLLNYISEIIEIT